MTQLSTACRTDDWFRVRGSESRGAWVGRGYRRAGRAQFPSFGSRGRSPHHAIRNSEPGTATAGLLVHPSRRMKFATQALEYQNDVNLLSLSSVTRRQVVSNPVQPCQATGWIRQVGPNRDPDAMANPVKQVRPSERKRDTRRPKSKLVKPYQANAMLEKCA